MAIGSVLTGLGVFLVALLTLLFRHPRAPGWTRFELLAMLLSVPVTILIGFGLGHVLAGVFQVLHGAGDLRGFLVLIAVAAVLVALILPVRRRIKAYAALAGPALVASQASAAAAPDERPQPPSPARPPTRKAA